MVRASGEVGVWLRYRLRLMAYRVLAVLGGTPPAAERLADWGAGADVVIAADSGADACLAAGLKPLVIGDMDSAASDLSLLQVMQVDEQDSTDTEKLLDWVAVQVLEAVLVVAAANGDRLDHELATLGTLMARQLDASLLLPAGHGYLVREGFSGHWSVPATTRFSVMPMPQATVSIRGAAWPLERAELEWDGFVSVSNRALDDIEVIIHSGCALITIEHFFEPWQHVPTSATSF